MATFSIPLARLAEKMRLDVETVVQKSTLDVFRSVVLKSPRDTGRFVANWNTSYATPNAATTQSTDQARGLAEAALAATLPVGNVVYLSNGLPYARRLEYGYSKQAPSGMVRLAALEFDQYVQRAIASK